MGPKRQFLNANSQRRRCLLPETTCNTVCTSEAHNSLGCHPHNSKPSGQLAAVPTDGERHRTLLQRILEGHGSVPSKNYAESERFQSVSRCQAPEAQGRVHNSHGIRPWGCKRRCGCELPIGPDQIVTYEARQTSGELPKRLATNKLCPVPCALRITAGEPDCDKLWTKACPLVSCQKPGRHLRTSGNDDPQSNHASHSESTAPLGTAASETLTSHQGGRHIFLLPPLQKPNN